jgi:hypothetical protein
MLNEQQNEIRQLKGLISDTQAEVKAEMQETENLVKAIEEQGASGAGQSEAYDKRTGPRSQAAPQSDRMTSDNDAR